MPLYEYRCDACGERFELIQKFSDPPPAACTKCGKGPVERLLSSPAIQFKGTGWYITDYSQKGKSGGESGTDSKTDGKTDAAAKTDTAKADAPAKPAPAAAAPASKSSGD